MFSSFNSKVEAVVYSSLKSNQFALSNLKSFVKAFDSYFYTNEAYE